jgi:hypothetical protein
MADWRQIQARIRKAKNAPDAHAKLSELFQRTRDAMVAWELGLLDEKALAQAEAVKWYTIAAQRFRRADWKKKAEEALLRLGAELPQPGAEPQAPIESHAEREAAEPARQLAPGEIPEETSAPETSQFEPSTAEPGEAGAGEGGRKKRRRGRRGGRGRRRKGPGAAPGLPSQAFAESASVTSAPPRHETPRPAADERPAIELPPPQLPSERMAHGRAGDPALASRMSQLESRLRRLLSSPLHRLDEVDEAPAGPGVFLLSDADQITSYYIEACQTLRIGLANLTRSGRGSKGGRGHGYAESGLKAKLAEHLEISEAKVSQYLKDHCVVRWIQLDDEAPLLAHFAISLLRTPLNLD